MTKICLKCGGKMERVGKLLICKSCREEYLILGDKDDN